MLRFGKMQSKNNIYYNNNYKKISATVLMNVIWSIPGVKDLRN